MRSRVAGVVVGLSLPLLAIACGRILGIDDGDDAPADSSADANAPTDAFVDGAPSCAPPQPPGQTGCDGAPPDLGNDEKNCGFCGHACGGEGCVDGGCVVKGIKELYAIVAVGFVAGNQLWYTNS